MMKHLLPSLFLLIFLFPSRSYSQLADGSTAPDWTLTDINGNTHHLYALLDAGKMVVIEFSATWCGPCWNYMQTGALETFWNQYGPNGTNQAQVFYIEADFTTGMADLLGQTPSSQGNWVAEIPFPIIDLVPPQTTADDYNINYYPTLYAVCSDRLIYEVGQVPASVWGSFVTSCTLTAEVDQITPAVCYGEGGASIDASGGVPPIIYNWSNGDHGPTLDNVGAGNYSVTVTESNQRFIVLEDIIVTGADEPFALAGSDIEDVICNGFATGSISVTLEEGTPPYTYDWSNGSSGATLINAPADEYTLTVTDNNGCTVEADFEITEPDAIEVDPDLTPDYCDQGNGTIALTIQGGVGGYEVSSSEGTVFGNEILDIPAGIVTVEVEDNNGCLWTDDYLIEAEPAADLYFSPDPVVSCTQPTTVVSGYLQGGSGDFEYQWSTTNGHITGPTNQSSITVDAGGDYNLEVYDVFTGCTVENDVEVTSTVDPPLTSAGDDSPISCENLQVTLSGVGEPNYTVAWTTTNGHIVSGANTYNPVVDAAGEYTITVLNPANSCTNSDVMTVLNNLSPAQSAYQFQTSALTMIGNDISTGSNVSGWSWTFGDGGTSNEPNTIHTFATAGTYDVCLTVQNGCGSSTSCQSVAVTFVGSVISVDAAITNVQCYADTNGAIALTVNGGSGVYTYLWTGPNGASYSTSGLENVPAGVYQLVISDDVGNLFIGEFTITEPTQIVLTNAQVTDNPCFGEQLGSITLDVTGGTVPFQYSIAGSVFQASNVFSGLPSGSFDGVVMDANGCLFNTGPHVIAQPEELSSVATITNVRCFGEANGAISLQLAGGVAPYTFLWSNGESSAPEIHQLAPGQYTCQVTDQHGCIDNIILDVTQPEILVSSNTVVVNATGPELNNGSITIEPAGGTAPYVVNWNTGATGNKIEGLVPGEYTYLITDANGCTFAPATPVVVQGIVATTDIDWNEKVKINPNPSNGQAIVSWSDLSSANGQITIMTLDGKKLSTRIIGEMTGSWDLRPMDLQSGVYLVYFQVDQQAVPFKLIVLN